GGGGVTRKGGGPGRRGPRQGSAAGRASARVVMSADKGGVRDRALLDDWQRQHDRLPATRSWSGCGQDNRPLARSRSRSPERLFSSGAGRKRRLRQ
ncbi:hypothetical protein DWU95_44535, partial [Burkholderia contaminans]